MREVDTHPKPLETAESLELDLSFEGIEGSRNVLIFECMELLHAVDEWTRAILIEERDLETYLGRLDLGFSSSPKVKRLHFGSPFQIELLMPLLGSAGLTSLFFLARRLYGVDLEFKAYREQRRVEYLEAKAKADELVSRGPSTPLEVAKAPDQWKLTSGTVRDPSS